MKLIVYGRYVEVTRRENKWLTFYLGNEGKKRLASDITIPDNITEADIIGYIADLCHEWATPENPSVNVMN